MRRQLRDDEPRLAPTLVDPAQLDRRHLLLVHRRRRGVAVVVERGFAPPDGVEAAHDRDRHRARADRFLAERVDQLEPERVRRDDAIAGRVLKVNGPVAQVVGGHHGAHDEIGAVRRPVGLLRAQRAVRRQARDLDRALGNRVRRVRAVDVGAVHVDRVWQIHVDGRRVGAGDGGRRVVPGDGRVVDARDTDVEGCGIGAGIVVARLPLDERVHALGALDTDRRPVLCVRVGVGRALVVYGVGLEVRERRGGSDAVRARRVGVEVAASAPAT